MQVKYCILLKNFLYFSIQETKKIMIHITKLKHSNTDRTTEVL